MATTPLEVTFGDASIAMASDQMTHTSRQLDRVSRTLSIDGAASYQDIRLARLAIYDSKPDAAEKLVSDAMGSLTRAKTDDADFVNRSRYVSPQSSARAQQNGTQSGGTYPATTAIA